MKLFQLLLFCCLSCTIAYSQQVYTLKDCISTGIERNLSIRKTNINLEKSKVGLTQSRSRLLPSLNGVFQFYNYLKNPVNMTTGTILGNDFPDDPTWQTVKSMKYNVNTGIQLSMPLYNQTIFAAINVAKTIENINRVSQEKAIEDLTMQISKIYYLAQASLELTNILDKNIQRMNELCEITNAMYQQGTVLEIDLTRAEINLKNLKVQKRQYETLHSQQLNMLRFILDLEPEDSIEVTHINDNIDIFITNGINNNLPELKLADLQKELAERHIKTIKAEYLPSLSFAAYTGALSYQEKFKHFFHSKASSENWFGNSFIGVTLKIPLFDANKKRHQIKQYKFDALQATINQEILLKQLQESYSNALLQFNYNLELFHTQSSNYAQAENVYNITQEQYKEGITSMTVLLQDDMRLQNAQAACINALCQCNISQLEILKLSGNLSKLTE